jgi:hypothetical protein
MTAPWAASHLDLTHVGHLCAVTGVIDEGSTIGAILS